MAVYVRIDRQRGIGMVAASVHRINSARSAMDASKLAVGQRHVAWKCVDGRSCGMGVEYGQTENWIARFASNAG